MIAAVILPYIAGSLSATTDEATWVLTSYLVANAGIPVVDTMVARSYSVCPYGSGSIGPARTIRRFAHRALSLLLRYQDRQMSRACAGFSTNAALSSNRRRIFHTRYGAAPHRARAGSPKDESWR